MQYRWQVAAMMATIAASAQAAAPGTSALLPGVFANEEQVQAARAIGPGRPGWAGLRVTAIAGGFSFEPIDPFGAATGAAERWQVTETLDRVIMRSGVCVREFARVAAGFTIIGQRRCGGRAGLTTATIRGLAMVDARGEAIELQRARGWRCTPAPGAPMLAVHDAGGRAALPSGRVLNLRHIAWPIGNGLPALILAIRAAGNDSALATATADPAATRIGVAMPGLSAMCRLDDAAKIPG